MIYKLSEANPMMYKGQTSTTNRLTTQASDGQQVYLSSNSRQARIKLKRSRYCLNILE